MKRTFIKSILLILAIFVSLVSTFADHTDPIAKTNVNKQTDLFEKSVGDVKGMEAELETSKNKAAGSLGDPASMEFITGKSRQEIEAGVAGLQSIKPDDLAAEGRKEMTKDDTLSQIYVDESNPLLAAHRKDAKEIANSTSSMLGKLTDALKEIGVDCRTVKGNKEAEPAHFIEIKKELIPEAVYEQKICEEPKNKYKCQEVLSLRCARKGAGGDLKYILVSRHEFLNVFEWVSYFLRHDSPPSVFARIKNMVSSSIGNSNIVIPYQVLTGLTYGSILYSVTGWGKVHAHFTQRMDIDGRDNVRVHYFEEKCLEWVEEANETCGLVS